MMRYIKLLIEYNGTNYHGWQSQKAGGTVQDVLRSAIAGVTGEKARLTGASRTDAGVHALAQVASFETRSGLQPEVIKRALNSKLPRDIRIREVTEVHPDFHPRYSAQKKSYFYIISAPATPSAFLYPFTWELKTRLDLKAMKGAASFLSGVHDFSAFRASGCSSKTQTRTIQSIELSNSSRLRFMTAVFYGNFLKIRIEADAFLRHMVRNIVGTLVEVGRGRLSPDEVRAILESRDRTRAGPTAPAQGLFLEKITY